MTSLKVSKRTTNALGRRRDEQQLMFESIMSIAARFETLSSEVAGMKAELQKQLENRDKGLVEISSSMSKLEKQMLGLRGRMSDLESAQRTAQQVGRYTPPPYVNDMAYRGAAFGEREKDRAPLSPYAD